MVNGFLVFVCVFHREIDVIKANYTESTLKF